MARDERKPVNGEEKPSIHGLYALNTLLKWSTSMLEHVVSLFNGALAKILQGGYGINDLVGLFGTLEKFTEVDIFPGHFPGIS